MVRSGTGTPAAGALHEPRGRHAGSAVWRPAAAGLLVLALVGCGPTSPGPTLGPTPSPASVPSTAAATPIASVDPQAVYAGIARQVEQIRGLQPRSDVTPVLIDEATLQANLTSDFDRLNQPAVVQAAQDELVELGLLPPGASLRQAELDLRVGQVAGYYSYEDKQLFVVSRSGGIGPTQRVTYAHEFTHELQDQNFGLAKLGLATPDQGDRGLARLALVEGDAVTTQATWMTENLSPGDLAQLLVDASDPAAVAALQDAPAILRETSLFPYTDGQRFVAALIATGGEAAVDAAFGDPPDSTEQILHPEKYLAHEAPLVVELPSDIARLLGSGWHELARDTLGELQIRAWLEADGVPAAAAVTAAAGWGGDRLVLLGGPGGALALGVAIRWDAGSDVDEFAAAADQALARADGATIVASGPANGVDVVVAPSQALARTLLAALGG